MQIWVTHDIFRCPALGQWDPVGQAAWLLDFVAPALHAVGAMVSLLPHNAVADAQAWLAEMLSTGACPAGTAGWCDMYGGAEQRANVAAVLVPLLTPDIVLGYELSANQMRFLAEHGRTFIDVGIDSVRFTNDMFFRVRTNHPRLAAVLRRFHVSAEELAGEAGFFRAHLARIQRDGTAKGRDLVFVGQVDVDASLICDGRLATVRSHLPVVADLLALHDRTILQPHPLARANNDIAALLTAFPQAVIGGTSVYHAICNPATMTVATLSSSVSDEADILGKDVVRLVRPDASPEALGRDVSSPYFRIDQRLSSAALWDRLIGANRVGVDERLVTSAARPVPDGAALRAELGVFAATTTMPLRRRELRLNEPVSMTEQENVSAYCAFGWSSAESVGVWSIGPVAAISFDVPARAGAVELAFCAFIGPVPRVLGVQLILSRSGVGHSERQSHHLDDERERCVTIKIPAADEAGRCDLTVLLAEPCSPLSVGLSDDTRELGICLSRVGLSTIATVG